ncbi:hypothetical protein [Gluconobacter albidus]|uniref:Uncharacterized protein n=1 Tax=Gluconobacter albidus TaxID=318683 RepID=A0AAW3R0J5_9PROT|nr:hypothetical protein [Gluconobacter albidus]KXV42198.1 hypothetical protein AD941_01605 [Gluconobacter albidus]
MQVPSEVFYGKIHLSQDFAKSGVLGFFTWKARLVEGCEIDNVAWCERAGISQALVKSDETMRFHKHREGSF